MQLLLEKGANIETRDLEDKTPLIHAASTGREMTVKLLLEHDADINVRDRQRNTPLHHAATSGSGRTVKLLLEKGADPYAQNWEGQAAPVCNCEVKKALLSNSLRQIQVSLEFSLLKLNSDWLTFDSSPLEYPLVQSNPPSPVLESRPETDKRADISTQSLATAKSKFNLPQKYLDPRSLSLDNLDNPHVD